ncbi:hypothetical protein HUJ04_011869 [Dendroctonus ponderosae]|nr:hypothetical protein HUJ04_011869 [Dendroctonus ponderosae]
MEAATTLAAVLKEDTVLEEALEEATLEAATVITPTDTPKTHDAQNPLCTAQSISFDVLSILDFGGFDLGDVFGGGEGGGHGGSSGGGSGGWQGHEHHQKTVTIVKKVPAPYPVEKTIHVPVEKKVPYPVKVPYPQPYPVEKKVPYPVKTILSLLQWLHGKLQ